MELKKNPKVDLQNKRSILLEIGLIVALAVVIGAFLYTPKEVRVEQIDLYKGEVEQDIVEVTRQDQKPPEPPKKTEITVITDVLNIVTNDTKITTDIGFTDFEDNLDEIVQVVALKEEEVEEEQIFFKVETMPSFMGGDITTFRNWVQSKVKYPQLAQENNISGRVLLMFVVEKDGTLTNIQVLQTPDSSLSDEAIRVLKTSPKWTPGKQRNQSVRVKYTLPIDFRIQN